ncbi:MAG: TonB-dependent siderophore receptor [Nostoc sp.]|uniref:TonB-dependent siderophore receptor n=1 Tax=Nostoc sp. TaxID=1180 RepID=UPI002FFB6D86
MKSWWLSNSFQLWLALISGCLSALVIVPVSAQVKSNTQPLLMQSSIPQITPTSEIVPITGVKANSTDKGVEIILEITAGTRLQVTNRSAGNNFIVDVSGGQLRLPSGDTYTFRSQKPLAGITEITVDNLDANTVRVIVVGEKTLPTVELYDDDAGLVFGITSAATATQPPQTPQAEEKPVLSAPQQEPAAQQNEPIELVVTGEQDGYRAQDASTATKTDTPLRDIPASIQVIPRQIIEDRAVTQVNQALQNVSGVNASTYQGVSEQINIRGFDSGSFFKNGSANPFQYDLVTTDNLERIEVLKGPAGVLFGQGSPGGIVNLVTKKPLNEPYYNLSFSAGSFGLYRPSLDISGPLNADKTLLYRFIGSYEQTLSFRDGVNRESYFFTPTVQWNISPATKLTLEFEFIDADTSVDLGIPSIGRGIAAIPISRYFSETDGINEPFGKNSVRKYNLTITLDHQFNQNWSVRNTFFAKWFNLSRLYPLYTGLNETTGELTRRTYAGEGLYRSYFNNLDILGNFKTGSIEHKLLAGFEYGKEINTDLKFGVGESGSYPSINIFNPIRSSDRYSLDTLTITNNRDENYTTYGFYLQDQIAFTNNLKLLLGGRFDSFERNQFNRLNSTPTEANFTAFNPRVGIVYQPLQPVSLYASFTKGFEPSFATLESGDIPPPQRSTQYEVGTKLDFGKFGGTLAFYDITKTNIPTADLNNSAFDILTGEVKSRGIELDISGEILPGLNVIAAYAYNDAFVSSDNLTPVGNRFDNAPRHTASLWTTYQLQRGNLKGLGFGLGVYYVGDRAGDLANTYVIPSYLRFDSSIFYRRDNWRAQLNFRNLFDTEYYLGSPNSDRLGVIPGAPFSVVGTISVQF